MKYAPKYRPPDRFTLPNAPWSIVERPANPAFGYSLRTDLPVSMHRFGVVEFAKPLTPDEVAAFELMEVHDGVDQD